MIDRCAREINESPESVTAFLATDLIATIVAHTNLSDYVLRTFLLERIVNPLIEDDHTMGDNHEKALEMSRQSAYIQIITNLASKLVDASKATKDQSNFSSAFSFFSRVLNNKLILIMDIGFKNADTKPVIFEKSLKLLATLGQLPTFIELMDT